MCGTADELEAIKSDHFNVTDKVIALLSRPYSVDQSSMSVLYAAVKELLNTSGTLLRGMEDPEDNGWYIPDFLCYGCIVGKSKQQRMDDFAEQEMEETSDEIVVMWNKDQKMAARGISISFVDIGHSFCGFSLEVLPYVNVPTSLVAGGGATMAPNPQFFVVPTAPPLNFSSAEMKTLGYLSQTSRGDRVDEEEYDAAFNNATQELNTQESVMTEAYASFLVVVPDGVFAGGMITAQSPDGVLYSVSVPEDAPPGSTLLVNPGTLEQSDVVATPYSPPPPTGAGAGAGGDVPPSYAQSFYHSNALDEKDTTVPPPYSASEYTSLPPPPAY
jgi:hypothetical protein